MKSKKFVAGKYECSKAKEYVVLTVPENVLNFLVDGEEDESWGAFYKICRELKTQGMTNYEIFGEKNTWNHILACCDEYVGEELCCDVVFWSAK